ncbi:MAG TPA: sugar phosphate isomerase/epimerase [Phototrophicaceae bacterium]|nr:sugar phosphate isomerase/epimerase [Phototrophicaceae bacterium]
MTLSSPAPIAVQLYTLRDALQNDLPGVLKRLAQIGFIGVEPYSGMDHTQTAQLCRDLGLTVTSAHLPAPAGENETATLKAAELYGIKRIIVPWQPQEYFKSMDGILHVCKLLNEANKVAHAHGLELGYHNHWGEVAIVDGRPAYQIMIDNLDADIFFEVDTYWVKTGGLDPVEVVKGLGKRAPLLHIKDGPAVMNEPMVAAGDGTLDIPGIVAAGSADWLVVELDNCATDMMTAVEKSYQYLTSKGLAHGKNN